MRKLTLKWAGIFILCLLMVACQKGSTLPRPIGQIAPASIDENGEQIIPAQIAQYLIYKDNYYYFDVAALRGNSFEWWAGGINTFTPASQPNSEAEAKFFEELGKTAMVTNLAESSEFQELRYNITFSFDNEHDIWNYLIMQRDLDMITVIWWNENRVSRQDGLMRFSIDPLQGEMLINLAYEESLGPKVFPPTAASAP